jgi:hypothetical protein
MPPPVAHDESVAVAVEGAAGLLGRVVAGGESRMALNPAIPKALTAASTPPVIMASAYPSLISRNDMPMALVPAAQAVTGQLMGPLARTGWRSAPRRDWAGRPGS